MNPSESSNTATGSREPSNLPLVSGQYKGHAQHGAEAEFVSENSKYASLLFLGDFVTNSPS